ncbi:MAG: GIN domain-containing protein [Bacteroidota bacterium]|jgi:hypothetical protein
MYRFAYIIPYFLIATIFVSCGEDPFCNCLQPTGKTSSEHRTLAAFQKIEVSNNINVNIHIANEHKAIVTCGKNLIDGVETEVEYGQLKIRNMNRCNWIRNPGNDFTVDIYTKELIEIVFRGGGNIQCIDTIKTKTFLAENWDATGSLSLKLDCEESILKIHTGPSDIIAEGSTSYSYLYNTGNGYIRAGSLRSSYAEVFNRGTGDCFVHSNIRLIAKIKYLGDVFYTGQPDEIQKEISGSGQLIAY